MLQFRSLEQKFTFDDVLMVPKFSKIKSRNDVHLGSRVGDLYLDLPIISSNMDTITGIGMAKKMSDLGGMGVIHRSYDPDAMASVIKEWRLVEPNNTLCVSVGSINREREKRRIDVIMNEVSRNEAKIAICAEIAHGHSSHLLETLLYIRDTCGFSGTVIAGTVCTPEAVVDLYDAGADSVRVGIGPGSACSTRIKTGCGYPQLSAIAECADNWKGVPIIADGGIRTPGDAAKALAAGASQVMIGGMLRGADFVPGWKPNSKLTYRGMASNDAKAVSGISAGFEEGISAQVDSLPSGSTEAVIKDIAEGIKSAMSYCGASNLKQFSSMAEFVLVSASCVRENVPHALY